MTEDVFNTDEVVLIGITGSIGMGKTTVANMMREMSIPVHDADAIVHFLLEENKESIDAVGEMFPEAVVEEKGDKYIDRKQLGHIVFMDPAKKKQLEDYIHPLVSEDREKFFKDVRDKGYEIAAVDIPLLFETGLDRKVDVSICVSAPREVQKERVLSRSGMTSEKFDAIVSGQMKSEEKCVLADYTINSNQDMEDMRKDVEQVISRIEAKYKKKR